MLARTKKQRKRKMKKQTVYLGSNQIERIAQNSRLKEVKGLYKIVAVLSALSINLLTQKPLSLLLVFLTFMIATLWASRLKFEHYLKLLSIPLVFIISSGLALLFEIGTKAYGFIDLQVFSFWISINPENWHKVLLILMKALSSTSIIHFLLLTTSFSDLLLGMKTLRIPEALISLSLLMYRYIQVVESSLRHMSISLNARQGFSSFASSVRSFGLILKNLGLISLARTRGVSLSMDARHFDGTVRLFAREKKYSLAESIIFVLIALCPLLVNLLEKLLS